MSIKKHTLRLACLLVAFGWIGWTGTAQATGPVHGFLLAPLGPPPGGSGGELQIGTGLPLPIGPPGIFLGGMVVGTAGTPFWPPLFVPPAVPGLGIIQTLGTGMGGKMLIPAGVLAKPAPGAPVPIAVFTTNSAVFQVATTITYAWPAAAASFVAGGAPGIVGPTKISFAGPGGGIITYNGGVKAFGGSGQFVTVAGPGAAGGRVPISTGGMVPVASVWINAFGGTPVGVMTVVVVGASAPAGIAQPGAPIGSPVGVTSFMALSKPAGPLGKVNQPITPTTCIFGCPVGAMGTIASSKKGTGLTLANIVIGSKGFPWSTGLITVSAPFAMGGAEVFFASGTDMRVAGVGNVSLVSGALSDRALSLPNANRGWVSLTLPEPTAALGAMGALAMLGLCHGLVRRRSR